MLRAIRFRAAARDSSSLLSLNRPKPQPPARDDKLLRGRMRRTVLASQPEQLPEQAQPAKLVRTPEADERFIRGIRRFEAGVDRRTVARELRDGVVGDAEWWRVEAHDCTHDEPDGGPCGPWEEILSSGSLPGWL